MNLSNMIKAETVIKIEHPEFDGFIVEVGYVSKDKTRKMIERATVNKYSKKTHQIESDVDNDLFLQLYTKALVCGWKGLKYKYLLELAPVDIGDADLNDEVEFSEANALVLMNNSSAFDTWLTGVSADIKQFSKQTLKRGEKE